MNMAQQINIVSEFSIDNLVARTKNHNPYLQLYGAVFFLGSSYHMEQRISGTDVGPLLFSF
jgi:hypothetical protein